MINAIEAMRDVGENERELLISTRNEPDGVSVEVRDSGPGFAPADLERGVRGLLHDEAWRFGDGPVDLPFDHRKPTAADCGRARTCPAAPASIRPAGDRKHRVVMLHS